MKNKLVAVVSSLSDIGVAIAQLTVHADGSIEHFGDPSVSVDTLALLLKFGPAQLQAMTNCPFCGAGNAPDHLKCDECSRNLKPGRGPSDSALGTAH